MECIDKLMTLVNKKCEPAYIRKSNYYLFNKISLFRRVLVIYYTGQGEDDSSPFNDIRRYDSISTPNFYNYLVKLYLYYVVKQFGWDKQQFLRRYFPNKNWSHITKKIQEFKNEKHRIRDEKIINVQKYMMLLPRELIQDYGIKYYTNILYDIIEKSPPTPCHMIVVRGVDGGDVNTDDIFFQKGFTSTTFDITRALKNYLKKYKCCFHIILIPKGTRCLYHKNERQIILNPGTRQVFGVSKSDIKIVAQTYIQGLKPNKILKYSKINNL
jgi:hypothetical protein